MDEKVVKIWRKQNPNISLSTQIRLWLETAVKGINQVEERLQAEVNSTVESVSDVIEKTEMQRNEVIQEQLEKSEELKKDLQDWNRLRIQRQDKEAASLKNYICKKHKLSITELVYLSDKIIKSGAIGE